MTKTVAIHQPNFFPWLGYFAKIVRSDYFVFFDDVQFPKTGGSWSNRVKLLVNGEARWVTAAIDRNYHGTRTIREMSFQTNNPWREKALKNIELNYRRHPYYRQTMELITPLLLNPETNIAEYNIQAITAVVYHLGLDTDKLIRSSSLSHKGRSNELLCSITQLLGGKTYMCGGGADGYQDESVFVAAGIDLIHQDFQHPIYPQMASNDFLAGLSIIDALMNVGAKALMDVLKNTEGL